MTDASGYYAQPCILVIEDSQALRTSVVEVLTWEGFRVVEAPNGRQGLEALRAEQPDLVICDIMMPDLDGYGVLAAMRADPKFQTVPFIFLTALAEHADVRQGMELGAVDYLAKPFAMRDLLAAVRTQLQKDADYRRASDLRIEALSRQLITALPHELRTPLTSVLGYTELMLEDVPSMDPSEIKEYLSIIHDAGERIKRLTENYLLYAQLEVAAQRPGALAVLRSQTSAHSAQLVGAIAGDCAAMAKREGDLVLSLDEDVPSPAIGSDYLSRITEELVMNALKFSTSGAQVHVSASATPFGMALTVRDAGRGMSREQVAAIGLHMQFERNHYEQQGTGMGLALVRRLVQVHEGRFEISSAPGEGTTVRIELPCAAHTHDERLCGVA